MTPGEAALALADGFVHPVTNPVHIVALLGLGIGTAYRGRPVATVAGFAAGLVGGLGGVAWGIGETPAPDAMLLLAALCGLAAAMQRRIPAGVVLAAAAGVAIGLDSPPEVISLAAAIVALIGTAIGGVAAMAAIAAVSTAAARPWHGIVLRVAGSWIAAIAILVLAVRWA
jgi:urease accessory protein